MSVDVQPKSYLLQVEKPGFAEFTKRIDYSMQNTRKTGDNFLSVIIQVENWDEFCRHHDASVVERFVRDLFKTVRKSVKPDQYVCVLPEGLGLIFEGISDEMVQPICGRLMSLVQFVIRAGHYNDLGIRWADVIQRFLSPHSVELIYPQLAFVLSPKDGKTSRDILNRLHQRLMAKVSLKAA